MHRITEFVEIKAYCDAFNETGHKGFKKPVNPFFWWNFERPGEINDMIHAYTEGGLVVVLELENTADVKNMLVFALCPQKNILRKILDITKHYDRVIYNSEFRDRYRNITKRLDGAFWVSNGRHYYCADGDKAWVRLYGKR